MDRYLSPAEVAKRFGVSIKALRLYERHGLITPLRTTNGTTGAAWRVYGSDQIVRLHQILALKRIGLSLARIGEILADGDALDPILAFQERTLVSDSQRIAKALTLIRSARGRLAAGKAISIDDLATLTQETAMTRSNAVDELKEAMAPFKQKHFTEEEVADLKAWKAGHSEQVDGLERLIEEAKALMASGEDATSASAMDWARRFQERGQQLASSTPDFLAGLKPKLRAMMDDAHSQPDTSPKLAVLGFIQEAVANWNARDAAGDA